MKILLALRARAFVCALALAAVGAVAAQTPPSAPADCHGIDNDKDRLACYDGVSGRAAAKPGSDAASDPAPSVKTGSPAPAATKPAHDALTQAVAKETAGNAATSMIDAAWDFDRASPRFDIRFYRENYFLPARYSDNVNDAPFAPLAEALGEPLDDINHTEAKFQISFKTRLWTTDDRRWGAWVGYTQQNQWQVYNGDVSRPFRETNYMPEAFVSYRPGVELPLGFRWNLLNAGYNHQSNGRTDTLSRSWNRLYAEFGAEHKDLALFAKVWYRLHENADKDDNPDITDYYGYGQLSALYRWRENTFSASLRGNVRTGKGAVEVNWFSPPLIGAFRGYVQFFSGYGESLIDYNFRQTTIGAGVALSDGL